MTKKVLRDELRHGLAELTAESSRAHSFTACDLLAVQPEFQKAEIVMVFLSMASEVSTAPLVLCAWQNRKRVLAPRVSWEQRRMMPVEIRSLDENIESTSWSFRQPVGGDPVPVEMIDLVVVPGLGFDGQGNRLGRGRGFYDRFLGQSSFQGKTCALAFECQVVQTIPVDHNDRPVDMLVTEHRVRRFRHRAT
jgi:5-formyltetrahydrofolate cyclo-ligase